MSRSILTRNSLTTIAMNLTSRTSILLAAVLAASSSRAGEIAGRVTLQGTPPQERTVDLELHPKLATKYPSGLTTRHYQVGPANGLQNVLVYVNGEFEGKTFPRPRVPAVLEHRDGLFQPYVMGVQIGQPLQLRCTDGTLCAFHATAKRNQEFNVAPISETVSRTFTVPEMPVRFKCDLHPWNYAYVGVFAHPFFAVTGNDGRFVIPDVPPGRYTLEIFQPKAGRSSKEVEVSAGRTVVDFILLAK